MSKSPGPRHRSIKFDAAFVDMARAVAAGQGVRVDEYIVGLVGDVVRRDYDAVLERHQFDEEWRRELAKPAAPGDDDDIGLVEAARAVLADIKAEAGEGPSDDQLNAIEASLDDLEKWMGSDESAPPR